METVKEDEEYNWREVKLPSLIPKVPEPDLERETGERRRGRDILVAIDHGPNSKNAFDWALVTRTVARIVEGDPGKVICKEAERMRPPVIIMGTRGRSLFQSVLQGSVGEYFFHNCKAAPIIIVPGKEAGESSVI